MNTTLIAGGPTRTDAPACDGAPHDAADADASSGEAPLPRSEEALAGGDRRCAEMWAIMATAERIAHVGGWQWDIPGDRLVWSAEACRVFGRDPRTYQPTAADFRAAVHPDDRERVRRAVDASLASGEPYDVAFRIVRPDDTERMIHAQAEVTRDRRGRPLRMTGTARDVTEQKAVEDGLRLANALATAEVERMSRLAREDALTGLANRGAFEEAVQRAIAGARRGSPAFALLYLDLDHFKEVNDTLGHPAGDDLVRKVADRLRSCVRAPDLVARLGGDEFAIIVSNISEPADVAALAERIQATLRPPFAISGSMVRIGASIGVAVHVPEITSAEALLSHADLALYRAKADGRGTYRFFVETMDAEVRKRVSLASELRDALRGDQFFLAYQPQVEIATGRITGVEALLRWRHPLRGVLTPGEFIPVAEKTGVIVPIGRWVLREACRQAKAWLDQGIAPEVVAVNVSGCQLRAAPELQSTTAAILAETGLPPERLELELTESVLMEAWNDHREVLADMRGTGVKTAIDDFGTGFCSLPYLGRFPVDRIKIAQTLVADLGDGPANAAIVRASIGLARELHLRVVAEGVETRAQRERLRAWGCRDAQGYCFARPAPAAEVEALLRAGSVRYHRGPRGQRA